MSVEQIKGRPARRVDPNSKQGMINSLTRDYYDHKVSLDKYVEISWGILDETRTYPVVEAADQSLKTEVSLEVTAGSGEIGKMTLFERIKKPIVDVFVARRRG